MKYKKSLIIHTDASSKNGYSCWCYKVMGTNKCNVGFVRTSNSAAMEVLAILKGIGRFHRNESILVFSDFEIAVNLINDPNHFYNHYLLKKKDGLYYDYRWRLINEAQYRRGKLQAIWINSRNNNPDHLEVDAMARNMLNDYLMGVKGGE